jgi:penicillin amidase
VVLVALGALAPAAAQAAAPGPYENVGSQYRNVLPPGSNGLSNGVELAAFLATGERPSHNSDQLPLYRDLLPAAPGLKKKEVASYFKDASFGVAPGDVAREYRPRDDVVIQRDRSFGVPHIYGDTRAGAMFGAGYVSAEDRLFFIDVLRHAGRGRLSSFAGGANTGMDRDVWSSTPYTEAELQRQYDLGDDVYGAAGRQLQVDAQNYVDGINSYISEARLNPLKMPGEYAAIGKPLGPDDWKVTDVIATASLVAGILGKGGGGELGSALFLQAARDRFGKKRGGQVWQDFRSAEDPEAPLTVHEDSGRFVYQDQGKARSSSRALPDRGSIRPHDIVVKAAGAGGTSARTAESDAIAPGLDLPGELRGLLAFPTTSSNALLVSARESASGHPLAVFGPQTAYFAPEVLMEQDIHAPKSPAGPAISARGVAFPGTNLYVQLGRGEGYSWSATSAGQDIIDTFAVELCEPGGAKPTVNSMHYVFRGSCEPIDVLEQQNSWTPTLADDTPAGSETLRSERTRYGIVEARATVNGKPVAYTSLRSTYWHEVDSALGFNRLNDPDAINSARDFQRAANLIDFTFNWFYADSKDIAYFNSGDNPVRAKGADPNFPVHASPRWEWRGWNPSLDQSQGIPYASREGKFGKHPQVINQDFLTSWNNKQAAGFRASDSNYSFGSVHRSQPLDDRIERGIRGKRKMTLHGVVEAMEDAATVDLRADKVLPLGLRVLGDQSGKRGAAVRALRKWAKDGAHRRDENGDGLYEHRRAIALLDAWWPLWMRAQFEPELRRPLFEQLQTMQRLDNEPNNHGQHLGSAYQDGWYGYASKDLRTLLGDAVKGEYSRVYCGGGKLGTCHDRLEGSLDRAIKVAKDPASMYHDDGCEDQGLGGTVECFDAIVFRPIGGITQPTIPWQNRPTFQQAIEIRR